jgi:hypothetical protein
MVIDELILFHEADNKLEWNNNERITSFYQLNTPSVFLYRITSL